MAKYQEMIETTVDMQQASQAQFVIKPDFDDTLAGKNVSFWFQENHNNQTDILLLPPRTILEIILQVPSTPHFFFFFFEKTKARKTNPKQKWFHCLVSSFIGKVSVSTVLDI